MYLLDDIPAWRHAMNLRMQLVQRHDKDKSTVSSCSNCDVNEWFLALPINT